MDTKTRNNPAPALTAEPRINWAKASPPALAAMSAMQALVNRIPLEKPLLELVKIRASMLNGCAFCIDMHVRVAKAAGESDQRLYLLSAWHESELHYTPRERAALLWTEALTRLAGAQVTDEIFAKVRAQFSEEELANLTLTIVTINGWNRFNVGFRTPPGFKG